MEKDADNSLHDILGGLTIAAVADLPGTTHFAAPWETEDWNSQREERVQEWVQQQNEFRPLYTKLGRTETVREAGNCLPRRGAGAEVGEEPTRSNRGTTGNGERREIGVAGLNLTLGQEAGLGIMQRDGQGQARRCRGIRWFRQEKEWTEQEGQRGRLEVAGLGTQRGHRWPERGNRRGLRGRGEAQGFAEQGWRGGGQRWNRREGWTGQDGKEWTEQDRRKGRQEVAGQQVQPGQRWTGRGRRYGLPGRGGAQALAGQCWRGGGQKWDGEEGWTGQEGKAWTEQNGRRGRLEVAEQQAQRGQRWTEGGRRHCLPGRGGAQALVGQGSRGEQQRWDGREGWTGQDGKGWTGKKRRRGRQEVAGRGGAQALAGQGWQGRGQRWDGQEGLTDQEGKRGRQEVAGQQVQRGQRWTGRWNRRGLSGRGGSQALAGQDWRGGRGQEGWTGQEGKRGRQEVAGQQAQRGQRWKGRGRRHGLPGRGGAQALARQCWRGRGQRLVGQGEWTGQEGKG